MLSSSELACKAIKDYYQEFSGSLQNTSHSKALVYSEKVEKLRTNFLSYLGLDNFLVSFQHNHHYLEQLISNFLDSQSDKWDIFTNTVDLKNKNYSLEKFLELDEIKQPLFLFVDGEEIDFSLINKFVEKLNYLKEQFPNSMIYSCLKSKNLNRLKNSFLSHFSFVSYDPSEDFSEFGTVFFGFQKDLVLKPLFLGSGGAKFDHQSNEIKLKKLPQLLEIGTQNLISWIVLAEYFEKLCSAKGTISLDSI
ncbi:hypothetical protein OVS_03010 [Mycoplasma ovis str. Michigan]|uniref:Uncharacterized protein n=1 Tax=Mycoplasma ovis str. Michigan TaxID=1415773 RepID=A0ABM5P1Q6_9MOLU|nr:hypothetical protein [Mycoplasma ovis]AHC40376.1 hypothetical protein OVS_03010 [Mycoplasma ovis str. Michigan]